MKELLMNMLMGLGAVTALLIILSILAQIYTFLDTCWYHASRGKHEIKKLKERLKSEQARSEGWEKRAIKYEYDLKQERKNQRYKEK